MTTIDHDELEADRRERDRPNDLRSLLSAGLCQMCGAVPNTGGMIPWYDGEVRHEELCPYCNEEAE